MQLVMHGGSFTPDKDVRVVVADMTQVFGSLGKAA